MIADLAATQHGMVTRTQLAASGLGADAIEYRTRVGRLHRLHRGIYAVGHVATDPRARAMAAVLACGPDAVLSHRSAGALRRVLADWPARVDVTAPTAHRHHGVTVHRSKTLVPEDRDAVDGIPVTSMARTLVDLAEILPPAALSRAVNEALLAGQATRATIAAALSRAPGRRTRHLAIILEAGFAPTRSAFEDAFLAFVRRHRLPAPEVNQRVRGHEVDMLWRDARLVVELDGQRFHGGGTAFERDRARDAELVAAGYRVVRLTWRRLREEPEREAARLRRLLAAPTAGSLSYP